MTLDSARRSDGCEASSRLPTGLCGSRIRTDDSFYVLCAAVSLLDDRLAADGHGGAGARVGVATASKIIHKRRAEKHIGSRKAS